MNKAAQSMEFLNNQFGSMVTKDVQNSSARNMSENSYSHFFEMNKTLKQNTTDSMFETTRNDISISTEIHQAPTGGNEVGSEMDQGV